MAFTSLRCVLSDWLKKRKLEKFFDENKNLPTFGRQNLFSPSARNKILEVANEYLKEQKKWPLDLAKATSFQRGNLTFECQRGAIASELHLNERDFRLYCEERIPRVKINRIFYRFI